MIHHFCKSQKIRAKSLLLFLLCTFFTLPTSLFASSPTNTNISTGAPPTNISPKKQVKALSFTLSPVYYCLDSKGKKSKVTLSGDFFGVNLSIDYNISNINLSLRALESQGFLNGYNAFDDKVSFKYIRYKAETLLGYQFNINNKYPFFLYSGYSYNIHEDQQNQPIKETIRLCYHDMPIGFMLKYKILPYLYMGANIRYEFMVSGSWEFDKHPFLSQTRYKMGTTSAYQITPFLSYLLSNSFKISLQPY